MIKLNTPLTLNKLQGLKVGEKILITGTIYTARDQAHIRLLEEDNILFDLNDAVIYYTGPSETKEGAIIGSCGPTSSYRMDNITEPLLKQGLRVMIGKGDRSEDYRNLLQKYDAFYLVTTGGAGALLSSCVISNEVIMYEDLMSEAIRKLEVKDFPCYIAYDNKGNSVFGE